MGTRRRLCAELGLGEAHVHAVRAQLAELAGSGLLVAEESLLGRCLDTSAPQGFTPSISSLGVTTRDRPLELQRNLATFAAMNRDMGRSTRILVADGSASADARRANREVLTTIKNRFDCEIRYIGVEEKSEFANTLSRRAQVPPDIVRFALVNDEGCPEATGGHRNALLLATLDELTVQVADHVEWAIAPGAGLADGITLTSARDPTSVWPDDDSRVSGDPDAASWDFLALHEHLLGKPLARCLDGYGHEHVSTDGIATSFVRQLRGGSGKVQITSLGVAGDLGTDSELPMLCADGTARDRLLRSADAYRRLVQSRHGVRAVSDTTVGDGAFASGLNIGLDNREPLPPFMPVQGNQDIIFAKAARATGTGLFGHLPWTIRHKAPQPRDRGRYLSAYVQSGDIMEALVDFFDQATRSGVGRNLAELGSLLVELGTLPPRDFDELLQRILWTRALQRIRLLDQLLAKHRREPDFWADDVAAYLSAVREAVRREDYAVPSDLGAVFGKEAASNLMERLVLNFGRLLQVWPHLRETALELRVQGHEFGRRI